MSVKIKRVGESLYQLIDDGGNVIAEYDQNTMRHPDDWIDDAQDAGELIHGPYDWKYIDARDTE